MFPYLEVSRNKDGVNHEICRNYTSDKIDGSVCTTDCEVICPTPVWDEGLFDLLWIFRWLPAILAVPFNVGVSVNELR
jgi:hypothetical protein